MKFFYITNGKQYLRHNASHELVLCQKSMAKLFEEKAASNVLVNLPKKYRKMNFYLEEAINNSIIITEENKDDDYPDYIANPNFKSELIKSLEFLSDLDSYAKICAKKEKEFDLIICDIRHYLRNDQTMLNIVQMYRLGKELQRIERERALCKQNRLKAEYINEHIKTTSLKEITEYIKTVDKPYCYKMISKQYLDDIVNNKNIVKDYFAELSAT